MLLWHSKFIDQTTMMKMTQTAQFQSSPSSDDNDDDSSHTSSSHHPKTEKQGLISKLKSVLFKKNEPTLRDAIEEYIEDENGHDNDLISIHEKTLISNVLELRDITVIDVMVPRADIVAIPVETTQNELLSMLSERQYSRLVVYKQNLDNVIGTLHIKDVIACLAKNEKIIVEELIREAPVVSPAMSVSDLLLQMRQSGKHLALVVDEFGGIDGIVAIGDVVETIVGDIADEHIADDQPELSINEDHTLSADARYDLDDFEERFGLILSEDEREEHDTLGGLVSGIAGRVPVRGEVLTHDSGMVFEVLESDPRRVARVKISNIPNISKT